LRPIAAATARGFLTFPRSFPTIFLNRPPPPGRIDFFLAFFAIVYFPPFHLRLNWPCFRLGDAECSEFIASFFDFLARLLRFAGFIAVGIAPPVSNVCAIGFLLELMAPEKVPRPLPDV
jgi:hypothetical protein